MKQYNAIKAKHPEALLLFRVGDFYETFGDDAIEAAKILNIILTKRGAGTESETALAGFPHHSLNTYLPKLVKAGKRVAICDQLEDPKATKTIVKRGVTELITPGTVFNDEVLESSTNNFLAAVYQNKKAYGVAFLDISTGEYFTSQGDLTTIQKCLESFKPSEVLIPKTQKNVFDKETLLLEKTPLFYLEDWVWSTDYTTEILQQHFKVRSFKGFGIDHLPIGIIAAGGILHYVKQNYHAHLGHITTIKKIEQDQFLSMDRFTTRNLELYAGQEKGAVTFLSVIDHTQSAMGARMLKHWLSFPLKNKSTLQIRQQAVSYFVQNSTELENLRDQINKISDIERLTSKLATFKISPKEVNVLKFSLEVLEPIAGILKVSSSKVLQEVGNSFKDHTNLLQKIDQTLNPNAPVNILKGGVIAAGFHPELDELKGLSKSGKEYLDQMLQRETEATGITSLKIASNNVFGYYIEVRNTHKDKVPENWIRKQTLVSAERYITEELKTYEAKILGAEEKILALERQLFNELLIAISHDIKDIQYNAKLLAQLDCLSGFAHLAIEKKYCLPELVDDTSIFEITDGRHPVIETLLPEGEVYVPNSIQLDVDHQQIMMITGPNMSGKSAILRQTALIVLLAQMGSFVPAKAAKFHLMDHIFTRVGASDNISMGESTFMVEMNETASILNNLSSRSLVLLDEIGRGTSTYDGISIAWAIAVYLHDHKYKPKTLFATHYHELNEMTQFYSRIKNYNVSIKELPDSVLFLRKLVAGGSHHSFGIHVAKMAGMPKSVLKEAEIMLDKLESANPHKNLPHQLKQITQKTQKRKQLDRGASVVFKDFRNQILELQIDNLTPLEALMKLDEVKKHLKSIDLE